MLEASGLVVQRCSLCSSSGRVRCCVCKAWYCTALCQADHWPVHRRVCVPVPGLEWPDGSRYEGQLEDGVRNGQLGIEHISNEESTSMKDVFVGRARIENIEAVAPRSSQLKVADHSIASANKEEVFAVAGKKDEKISLSKSASRAPVPDKLLHSSSSGTCTQQPAVDIRAKSTPSSPKEATSPAESVPIPAKPVTSAVKLVPTAAKLVPNPAESIPAPEKASQTLAAKPSPLSNSTPNAAKPAAVSPKPNSTLNAAKPAAVSPKAVATPVVSPTKPAVSRLPAVKQPVQLGTAVAASTPHSTPDSSPAYLPAYQSSTLPPQVLPPPGKLSQIVLPVEDIVSPANFWVRLTCDDALLMKLLEGMNENPPPTVQGWTVGRRETVAVYYEDIWYRGLAVKKVEGMFSMYLLDFGGALVNVAPGNLRPLPSYLSNTPAVMYQVCLAGLGPVEGKVWGKEVGQLMGEIVNSDPQYKLGVEFLGQVEGGRWVVKLRGIEDEEDIGNMMVEGGLAKAREDGMNVTNNVSPKDEKKVDTSASKPSPITANNAVSTTTSVAPVAKTEYKAKPVSEPAKSEQAKAKAAAEQVVPVGPKIPRGVLPVNNTTVVGVCFLDTPDKFYVCPSTCIEQFMSILSSAQSAPSGSVSPVVGSSCLAMDEDCWYRAEMVKLSPDKTTTLFLLDYGKTVQATLSTLRPIPSDLATTPGLVCLVTLRGIKPGDTKWSSEEIAGALLVLDVGGETQFKVKNAEVGEKFKMIVSMEDLEGNDIADLMVETGIAEKDEKMMCELKLIPGTLVPGQQQLLVLSAVSPMEINLCSQVQFLHFSDAIVPMVKEAASKADKVLSLAEGDTVLACEDQVWYRASVIQLLPENAVEVILVDLAITATVPKDKLRVAEAALMKEPVVAVSCCLDTWVEEDRELALEKWGDKMEGLLEQYTEVDVEVVDLMDSQAKVRIPILEHKLGKKEMSRAEMLKMRLKQKK